MVTIFVDMLSTIFGIWPVFAVDGRDDSGEIPANQPSHGSIDKRSTDHGV
jgi:hypothetical protein